MGNRKATGKKDAASPRAPRRKKEFRLEVGKTYETENGTIQVKVIDISLERHPSWAAAGELVKGDIRSFGRYWYENGLYHALDHYSREGWLDLVREVPAAGPRGARKKKPTVQSPDAEGGR
jgi:hypothetical protein